MVSDRTESVPITRTLMDINLFILSKFFSSFPRKEINSRQFDSHFILSLALKKICVLPQKEILSHNTNCAVTVISSEDDLALGGFLTS